MKLRRLGNSGLKVSEVGLGCNNFGMRIDADETEKVVDAAIDFGWDAALFTDVEDFRKHPWIAARLG